MYRQFQQLILVIPFLCAGFLAGCKTTGETGELLAQDEYLIPGIFLEEAEREVLPRGVTMREIFPAGLEVTKSFEGWRASLYDDPAGYCTIGWGHLVKRARCDDSEPLEFRRGITKTRGTEILRSDMTRPQIAVMNSVKVNLTDGQYAALCDFVFNVGTGNFKNSTLLKMVNARQHDRVPWEFRRWVKAGNKVYPGLQRRRESEINLYFDGKIPRGEKPRGVDLSPIDIRTGEPTP